MNDLTPYNQIQDLWAQGIHVDSKGVEHNLVDMPPQYLQNVINKFGPMGYDINILEGFLSGVVNGVVQATADVAPVSQATQ